MSFREFLKEAKEQSYNIPWDDGLDKSISKWERKYSINIESTKDEAIVSGQLKNIQNFLSKELDYEEEEFEMADIPFKG